MTTHGEPLSVEVDAALRASIVRHGVIVPVVLDQHGNILDGNNRTRIGRELGVPVPTQTFSVANAADAAEVARSLNEDRRQMPRKERQKVVRSLRADGHSTRAIAAAVGVTNTQVVRDLKSPVTDVTPEPTDVIGRDGKHYPASRKAAKPVATAEDMPAATAEWLRLRRLGQTQVEAGRGAGMRHHDIRRAVAEHGDPLPLIGGMNAYEMLDSQTRQLDFAASLIGQIVAVIDPSHEGVKPFLLALRKIRKASDDVEHALRRANIKVIA